MFRSNLRVAGIGVLGILIALVIAACAPVAQQPSSPVAQQPNAPAATVASPTSAPSAQPVSLRMAILTDERILQPYAYVTGYPGWNMLGLVYDSLFVLDANNTPKPWLATGDQVSADGLTHTITLRDGVKWQDGQPFTSADVKFAFEYYQKNTHSRWTPPVKNITSIETPDDKTVVITLPAPDPSFERRLLADVPIIPQHVWKDVTEPKTFENNIGTGPFKLAEHKLDEFYRFEANPDYFMGKPAVDEILMPIIKDPTTVFSSLKTGEIQATTVPLSPELVKDFEGNSDLKVERGPGFATTMLQFNDERAPWDNAEVRQAVALAIDTQKLVDTVLLGYGTPGNPGWLHPAHTFHDPSIKAVYDPAKAKEILDGLGYKDTDNDGVREADGKPMAGELLVQSNNPQRIRSAELIAAALKEIGLNIKVTSLDTDSVDAKTWPEFDVSKGRDFDLAMWGWSAPVMVNPLRMTELVVSDPTKGSINIGGYKNPEVDTLAAELTTTVDPVKQKELIQKLEAIIARDLPFVMLYYQDGIYAFRPATYGQWMYQQGQGIMNKLSFLPNAKP
ncbi:MAG: ABC transporter substrate-binding protein [Anaerolineae bacterium]|nr:ABC transporter substrate-binding protein [Anaerolineae bacterium]